MIDTHHVRPVLAVANFENADALSVNIHWVVFQPDWRLNEIAYKSLVGGFAGEIVTRHRCQSLVSLLVDFGTKLHQLLDIQANTKDSGSTTVMARLTHARLYGSDRPYETRTPAELMAELAQIEKEHRTEDDHFLFETNAQKLQLVVYNQGDDPIQDASLAIVMPNHTAFYVASQLPKVLRNGKFVDRAAEEMSGYPSVNLKDNAVYVSNTLGEIPLNAPVNVFDIPLRICVGSDLKGRKLGIRYSLFGSNLRSPAKGKLRLLF